MHEAAINELRELLSDERDLAGFVARYRAVRATLFPSGDIRLNGMVRRHLPPVLKAALAARRVDDATLAALHQLVLEHAMTLDDAEAAALLDAQVGPARQRLGLPARAASALPQGAAGLVRAVDAAHSVVQVGVRRQIAAQAFGVGDWQATDLFGAGRTLLRAPEVRAMAAALSRAYGGHQVQASARVASFVELDRAERAAAAAWSPEARAHLAHAQVDLLLVTREEFDPIAAFDLVAAGAADPAAEESAALKQALFAAAAIPYFRVSVADAQSVRADELYDWLVAHPVAGNLRPRRLRVRDEHAMLVPH